MPEPISPSSRLRHPASPVSWTFVIAAVMALLAITIGFQAWRDELLRDARQDGQRRLQGVARVLESPRVSIEAGLAEVVDMVAPVVEGRMSPATAAKRLRHVQALIPAVRTAVIFDAQGMAAASSRAELVGRNFGERAFFRQALQPENSALTLISQPYMGALGVWVVNVTFTVRDAGLQPLGVASLTLDPEFLGLALDLGSATRGEYRALVHPSGKVMVDFDPSGRMRSRVSSADRIVDLAQIAPPASRSGDTDDAVTAERIIEGTDAVLIQTLWVPWGVHGTGQGWIMMSVRPVDEVLVPWRAGLGIALLSFLVIFGTAGAMMQFAAARSRRRVRRLEQARRLHERNESLARRESSRLAVTASVAQLAGWTVEWPTRDVGWSDEMVGLYDLGEPVPHTLSEMSRLHTSTRLQTLEEEVERCLRERSRFDEDFCCELPAGTLRWFRLAGGPPVRTAEGSWVLECVAMDITYRVVSQRVAQEQRERLEEALRQSRHLQALGTLAGGVAHDFNNLLGIVLVNAREVQAQLPPGHPASAALDHIIESGLIGRSHVERIQAVASSRSASREGVDVRQVLGRTVELLRTTVPARIRVDVVTPAEAVWLEVDVRQLQQVILNLASNAVLAMPEPARGVLTLSLDCLPGAMAQLSCRDSGVGMPEAVRQRALEPFFTTREAGQGAGLGLSMAHAFARDHGGGIEIESAPGAGTTVRLRLPLASMPAPVSVPVDGEAVAPSGAVSGETVMSPEGMSDPQACAPLRTAVVDDNRLMRHAVKRQLERLGYCVDLYASGPELFDAIGRQGAQVDAVLTDFNLPEMSGLEVIQGLRDRWPSIPAILYSGYVRDDVRERATALGAVAVLRKEETATRLPEIMGRLARWKAESDR